MEPDIKALLEENLRLTREVYDMAKSTRRHIRLRTMFSVLSFVLIVAPLVFALIYLPPLLRPYIEQYQGLLGVGTNASAGSTFSVEELMQAVQMFKTTP